MKTSAPSRFVTANCLHAGVISTKLSHIGFGSTGASLEEGAATSVYVASVPELDGISGKYFAKRTLAESFRLSHDAKLSTRFWEETDNRIPPV